MDSSEGNFSENQNQQFQNTPQNQGYYSGQGPVGGPVFQRPVPLASRDNSGRATASLVLGILSWITPGIGLILAILGIIFGASGMKSRKKGMAIAGIILSCTGFFISLISAAIILVTLDRVHTTPRKPNNERVVSDMNQLRSAAEVYYETHLRSYEGLEKSEEV